MKVKLKSKLGRPFWRFGTQLSPDSWTEFDLSDQQLATIKDQCTTPVSLGGTLEIDPNPWAATAPPPAQPKEPEPRREEPRRGR